jgi:hypothetical protein
METENAKKTSGSRIFLLTLVLICISFLIYFSIMSMRSPGRKMAEIKKEFTPEKTDKKNDSDKTSHDAAYLKLLKERAFLQSRIIMAESDSIYLTINLADSSINLEISGVVVHMAKMNSFKVSNILMKGDENIILSMFSTPFTIASDFATIKKEPLMIKMAPKDTSEYKPDMMPDTSITEPVNYILAMTNGTRIYVYQEEVEKRSDRMSHFMFDINDRLRETWKALRSVAVLKVPEYHPFIKISLPRSDAKIIYRAIPKYGQVGIYK